MQDKDYVARRLRAILDSEQNTPNKNNNGRSQSEWSFIDEGLEN